MSDGAKLDMIFIVHIHQNNGVYYHDFLLCVEQELVCIYCDKDCELHG